MDYATLDNLLVGRNKASKKLGNNTYAIRNGEGIHIKLHDTNIMTFQEAGGIVLNAGGWRTVTTKQRLNEYLPAGWFIAQHQGVWDVCYQGKRVCLFEDGMEIQPLGTEGQFIGGSPLEDRGKVTKERKAAREYAKGFIAALVAGQVPLPSGGDCWFCYFKDSNGKTMGDGDATHIRSHMSKEELYYVPSLLVNACEMFGASVIARQVAYDLMSAGKPSSDWLNEIATEQLTKAVYRYVLRQLGHAT